jgi:hypothetical protein
MARKLELRKRDESRIGAAEMEFVNTTAGCARLYYYNKKLDTVKELNSHL